MSKRNIWTIKLIINLYLPKSWLILYSTHPLKKTNFSEDANLITYNILLTAEKLVITFAMNRLACCEQLCAFLRNSLYYRQCYEETRVWGRYTVYKTPGWNRVNTLLIMYKSEMCCVLPRHLYGTSYRGSYLIRTETHSRVEPLVTRGHTLHGW